MSRKPNTTGGRRSTIVEADMGSAKKKAILINIAANKGCTLTALVRTTMFELIEKSPEHLKKPRRNDEDSED